MSQLLTRPALGQYVLLGTLYDAKSDTFLDQSILGGRLPADAVKMQELSGASIEISSAGSYADKTDALNIGPDLAASFISGLLPTHGLSHCLVDRKSSSQGMHTSVYHSITTIQEALDLSSQQLRSSITPNPLKTSEVTHVVVEIDYGAQSVITASQWAYHNERHDKQDESIFKQMVQDLVQMIEQPISQEISAAPRDFDQITVHSTILGHEAIVLNSSLEAKRFLDLVPLQMKAQDGGKGRPILYRLLPIQMLSLFNLIQIQTDKSMVVLNHEYTEKFIRLCDEIWDSQQSLEIHEFFAARNKFCLPPNHLHEISQRIHDLKGAQQELKRKFGQALQCVRAGSMESHQLLKIINDFVDDPQSLKTASAPAEDYHRKIEFIDKMTTLGATYFGFNGVDLHTQIRTRSNTVVYAFQFDESARKDQESWDANEALMLGLLDDHRGKAFLAIVDRNGTEPALEKAIISKFYNGVEVVHDLQEEQYYLAVHCFAKRQVNTLESDNIQKPTKRRFVKIPCPGQGCAGGGDLDWQCLDCRVALEYGFTDQYIYCDCGRSLYNTYDFKCNSPSHGQGFERYDDTRLMAFLNSLTASNYLNILILGETGVGKSTFINAFVNYLCFATLDDALRHEELHWVIPCSFAIQTMDRSNKNNEIIETKIEVGSRDDEHDGSRGKSATQSTQVYPINVEETTYRLIDTPGIGDTRGLEFDKKNMEDILRTVSAYDDLHGILILLKPNNARLTAQFSFCVKELLTHLHRDAANNVVFGFTNTRVSNYTPGDTLGPLKTLLEERKDIGLSLTKQTTYCFDSESFRYLAAYKNNVFLENKPNFDSSWATSRAEAELMLNYFRGKRPHPVKNTISLNATRNLILELVKPMTDITQVIRTNIGIQEDDMRLLRDHRLTGDKLRAKLNPEKELLRKKDTQKPRTVCTDKACVEYKDDGTGNQTVLMDYPDPCHPRCYLEGIEADVRAHVNLDGCSAFAGHEDCQKCGHHWTLHKHILYELEIYREKVLDHGIQKLIREHASDYTKKQAAINTRKQLVAEYQEEHDQVQEAAAKFGVWMKENSILPYNDATVSYLEILIKAEQAKVDAGGINNKRVLADLQQDLHKHEELVRVLDDSMKSSGKSASLTQAEIQQIVQKLYNLKHFGDNLQSLKILNTQEHEKTNREKPHRVKVKQSSKYTTYTYHTQVVEPRKPQQSAPSSRYRQPQNIASHNYQPKPVVVNASPLATQEESMQMARKAIPGSFYEPEMPTAQFRLPPNNRAYVPNPTPTPKPKKRSSLFSALNPFKSSS